VTSVVYIVLFFIHHRGHRGHRGEQKQCLKIWNLPLKYL